MSALLTLFSLILFAQPAPAAEPELELPEPWCAPVGEQAPYDNATAAETRARVRAVCDFVGASEVTCAFLDAVTVRESAGRPGARHTKGTNENGLGPMGLSLRWNRGKWPGDDEDPMFCHPEVSALVALAYMHRAYRRYDAHTMLQIQAIYAGKWSCWTDEDDPRGERKVCRAMPTQRTAASICGRLQARGHSCHERIERSDLGRLVPLKDRRRVAAQLIARFNARSTAS